ncbi:MAG: histidine phosphatase family protein [Phycisphaerae bacterium]|jgi:broad specificity phosphatase PhoE|nr:histidine phosphatase family protein [Phycisphaerae bacterium]
MAKLFVVQTGQTIWEVQDRIESVPGAPLTEAGASDVERAADELAACGSGIRAVYACDGESERETACLIAQALGTKVRTEPELRELDYGLWQGLTRDELKRRQPKMYRQWADAPSSVRPPGGETLEEAQERLRAAIKGILKRHKDDAAVLILRPVAVGLLRCLLTNDPVTQIWKHVDNEFTWGSYEMDSQSL